jgi:hypothetical protein
MRNFFERGETAEWRKKEGEFWQVETSRHDRQIFPTGEKARRRLGFGAEKILFFCVPLHTFGVIQ